MLPILATATRLSVFGGSSALRLSAGLLIIPSGRTPSYSSSVFWVSITVYPRFSLSFSMTTVERKVWWRRSSLSTVEKRAKLRTVAYSLPNLLQIPQHLYTWCPSRRHLLLFWHFKEFQRIHFFVKTSGVTSVLEHWVVLYGIQNSKLTRNGLQFASKFFAVLCALIGTTPGTTTNYHPKTNEKVKRFNKPFVASLCHYIDKHLKIGASLISSWRLNTSLKYTAQQGRRVLDLFPVELIPKWQH